VFDSLSLLSLNRFFLLPLLLLFAAINSNILELINQFYKTLYSFLSIRFSISMLSFPVKPNIRNDLRSGDTPSELSLEIHQVNSMIFFSTTISAQLLEELIYVQ
jgi:hypothetical protein